MSANVTRRTVLALGTAAIATGIFGVTARPAFSAEIDDTIAAFTGGKEPQSGRVSIDAPEIAENGNTVPVGISVESPMTADDHVASVLILAAGNPRPGVATFNFTPMSGEATAQTRMRLAKTQDVIAIAKMNDGSVYMDKRTVKVTIGGCGG